MKKLLLALLLVGTIAQGNLNTAYAHGESSTDKGSGDTTQTATVTEADFDFSVDSTTNIATLLYADGTPLANAAVTVKNGTAGQDGDIEQNLAADANGAFDYSKWMSQNVQVLRVTDPVSNNAIEYNIETGAMTIEAGKNKSGDGSGGGGQTVNSSNTYMIIGGVAVVVAGGTGVSVMMQKKKKAAFEAKTKGKNTKKASKKSPEPKKAES